MTAFTTAAASDVVTVLTVDPDHRTVIELLEHWTAAGLLQPSLLVDETQLAGSGVDVGALRVQQIDATGTRNRLLRDAIGARQLSLMRFVAVRPIVDDERSAVDSGRINALADAFESILALRTRFVRINLVIPSVPGTERLPTLLEPRWDVNVVVAPEDRPNDAAIDHGVSRPDAYTPHAALACASIAGLWKHVPAAPFDEPSASRMVGNHRRIVVARTAVRLVDNRELSDQVVNRIVRADTTALMAQDGEHRRGVVHDSGALVREAMWAFRENVDKRPFDFHPLPEPKRARPPRLKYTRDGFVRATRQLVRRRVDDVLSSALGLTDSAVEWLAGAIPTFRNFDDSWNISEVPPTPRRVHQMAQSAPGMLPKRKPAPGWAWRPLRQMCLGLVDGGPLPDEIGDIAGGRGPRVSRAEWIVPSPVDSFKFTSEESAALRAVGKPCGQVRATDLNAAVHVGRRLDDAAGDAKASADPERGKLLDACRERFREWNSRERSLSLIGQLTDHVNDELLKAREDLEMRARQYEKAEQDRQTVHRLMNESYQKVRTGRRWVGPSATGSGLLAIASLVWQSPALWLLPFVLAVPTAVFGLWWGGRMTRYLAREVRLEHELLRIEYRRAAIVAAVQSWPTEADRLASVYDVLTDWGEIIGWMLHKPFGRGEISSDPQLLDVKRLPQAFQFAEGGEDTVLDRLVRRMADEVFAPGWVSTLYTDLQLEFLGEHTIGGENDPDYSSTLDVDDEDTQAIPPSATTTTELFGEYADVYEKPPLHNARARFVKHFRDDKCGVSARRSMITSIRQALRRVPVEELAEKVTIQRGDDLEQEVVAIRDFLQSVLPMPIGGMLGPALSTPAFTLGGTAREKSSVDSVHLWCPESFDLSEQIGDPRITVTADRSVAMAAGSGERHLLQVTRLDLSADCIPEDIKILSEPVPATDGGGLG